MSTVNQPSDMWSAQGVAVVSARMSEAEYDVWLRANPDSRSEWVEGELIVMSPVSYEHADLNLWLGCLLREYVEAKGLGKVIGPEFTARLRSGKSRRVPDLLFIAESRRDLIRPMHLDGPPDLAVEIVSNDSLSRDYREKYLEYEAAGVREYWIVDPFSKHIEAYSLDQSGKFAPIAEVDGKISSTVLDGFCLSTAWLWTTPRPTALSLLAELLK
jgi:Uma2 family endonuclease